MRYFDKVFHLATTSVGCFIYKWWLSMFEACDDEAEVFTHGWHFGHDNYTERCVPGRGLIRYFFVTQYVSWCTAFFYELFGLMRHFVSPGDIHKLINNFMESVIFLFLFLVLENILNRHTEKPCDAECEPQRGWVLSRFKSNNCLTTDSNTICKFFLRHLVVVKSVSPYHISYFRLFHGGVLWSIVLYQDKLSSG